MDNFLHHYLELLRDPAHMAVELTFMLVVDILVLGLVWPWIRRAIDRRIHAEHHAIDVEHGVQHQQADDHLPRSHPPASR